MGEMKQSGAFDADRYVQDLADRGEFRVHRDVFRDETIFDLEMRHIFEATWVFVGLAAQLPNPHDYLTTRVGRQPVIVSRDGDGKLHCHFNTCPHRGATLCRLRAGSSKAYVCPYHGWMFDSAGRNVGIKNQGQGEYHPAFADRSHDLKPVPRFAEYRGFLFASLSGDVPGLEEHLGDARVFLDLIADQGPDGMEPLPGVGLYTYRANWKLQLENCLDNYHLTSTHPSFMRIVERRKKGQSRHALATSDFKLLDGTVGGGFTFPHGHAVIWHGNATPEVRPLYATIDEVVDRVGSVRANWMLGVRNLSLFPNVQFAENISMQMRIIRPVAPDLTEMQIFCLAPRGESADSRAYRIRLYEDFFNSTGLATPDDLKVYEQCQDGYRAWSVSEQQGYHRGMTKVVPGPDDYAEQLGIQPETSVSGTFEIQDETIFHAGYREWLRLMKRAGGSGRALESLERRAASA
jgi:benzoate/toluate 1,2-dioxygenase alpha subunit